MPSSRRRRASPKPASMSGMERLWRWSLAGVVGLAFLPGSFAFVGYAAEVSALSYDLVKASMPFIPLGALLMLVWRKAEIQVVTLALFLVLLPVLWILPDWGWAETRNMLFAWPGLALGMALAAASQREVAPAPTQLRPSDTRT